MLFRITNHFLTVSSVFEHKMNLLACHFSSHLKRMITRHQQITAKKTKEKNET
jgi:hypothetical protein